MRMLTEMETAKAGSRRGRLDPGHGEGDGTEDGGDVKGLGG